MRRLKTIDEIYEEVKGCDLVITNDISLETALNSRIAEPRIGQLAMTPRHIAEKLASSILGKPIMSDLQQIATVSEETGYGFRQVYSEILNIRDIRNYTEDVRGNLTGRGARAIYDSYSRLPTLERAMSEMDPEDGRVAWFFDRPRGVAVVGLDLFDDLDKHCVPFDFLDVDVFTDGEYGIDTIHIVGNDRLLAENAADLIDPERPADYAIVLSANSPIADAVRSSLYRRQLPFVNSLNVRDLAPIRDYISFLTLSLSYPTLRVRQVKELYSNYGGGFRAKREGYLLSKQTDIDMLGRTAELREAMRAICEDGMTFGDAMAAVCGDQGRHVKTLLNELDVAEKTIVPDRLAEVRFAVENVQQLTHNEQIPENERSGVLIADCKNSVFVDKPVVIYLGLGQEWTIPVVGRRYMDSEAEAERNALRLEALLQQGQRRLYCVNSTKNGKPASPSVTFDSLVGKPVSGFGDIAESLVRGRWAGELAEMVAEDRSEMPFGDGFDEPFSKSTFNAYASCPRKYLFQKLLTVPDETSMEFGNLVHEFAEFYACYGELARRHDMEEFVSMVADSYSGLSTPLMDGLDRTRIRIALENVRRYIDACGVAAPLNKASSGRNRFMAAFGLEESSDACETDHSSADHPIHGLFDLLWEGDITDYKTGRGKDAREIRAGMNLDEIAKYPEFQPLIYLALAMEAEGAVPRFTQLYVMDNDTESVDPGFDIRRNIRTISLSTEGLDTTMRSQAFVDVYAEALSKEMKPHAASIISAMVPTPPDPKGWSTDDAILSRVLVSCGIADTADGRKKAATALKKLASLVEGGMTCSGSDVCVPIPFLERFLDRLDLMHETLRSQVYSELPADPQGNCQCRDCGYFEACTRSRAATDGGASDE
ncbi:MAG: PD-(D/E)XK nuclease family protein [Thermoplasmata archaeon]|nr:PD-(D/E)XK nuclease family protein [Thermoplasmata archaeon]